LHRVPDDCQIPHLSEIYSRYLPDKGIFVEVGAYDGETHSNTCLLADDGWEFIYIEAIEEYWKKCQDRHLNNNGTVIKALVGDGSTKYIYPAEEWSTIYKENTESLNKCWGVEFGDPIELPSIPLNQLIESTPLSSDKIDLLVVDVEGGELEVLLDFDFDKYTPTMCIIEMHEQHHPAWHTPEHIVWLEKLNNLMQEKGYTKIYSDQINTIFVK